MKKHIVFICLIAFLAIGGAWAQDAVFTNHGSSINIGPNGEMYTHHSNMTFGPGGGMTTRHGNVAIDPNGGMRNI